MKKVFGKRGISLLLAGILMMSLPLGAYASDESQELDQTVNVTEEAANESRLSEEEGSAEKEDSSTAADSGEKEDSSEPVASEEEETSQEEFISIEECDIQLSASSFTCDGKEKKPDVTVKYHTVTLTEGTDYRLSFQNHIQPGTATVEITGLGSYTGMKEVNYVIQPGKTSMKSTSSYEAITVSWSKVTGADGYQLYRSTSKTSGFKRIKTLTGTSYKDSNTKFNGTYYYKVRAYHKTSDTTLYGAFSAVKSQKKMLAAPTISSVKKSGTSAKISWKKVNGATGYIIYYSKSQNGTYKRLKAVKKASARSYTHKKAASKKYYYKVKAYRKVNKKNYHGYLSTAKKLTTAPSTAAKLGGGWRYVNGYKLYYDKNGKLVKDVSSIIGKQSSYVIKVNKKRNCVTVYAKDGKKGYIIPVKAFVCSAGKATPILTAYTPAKYRWRALNGNCYGQWCTRIKYGYLFHSVMYGKTKNTTLSVSNYNKLGTTASHGCIRLKAGDAKWIYDNCKLKTKVVIYNSSTAGPLGKPTAVKLPKWHKWDPTDPTAKYKCKQKGCH